MSAEDALELYVGHTFDYHAEHPEFVRLVMNENIHYGAHIGAVPGIKERNRSVIATLQDIIDKGDQGGRFRKGLDPVELHMLVSALCFYNVSNRYHVRGKLRRRHGAESRETTPGDRSRDDFAVLP